MNCPTVCSDRRITLPTFTAWFALLATIAWADPLYVNRTSCVHRNVGTPQIVDVFYETTGPVPCYVRYTKAGATKQIGAANVEAGKCEFAGRKTIRNLVAGGFSCTTSLKAAPAQADFSVSLDQIQPSPLSFSEQDAFAVIAETAADEDRAHIAAAGIRRRFPNVEVRVFPPVGKRQQWSVALAMYVSRAGATNVLAQAKRHRLGNTPEVMDIRSLVGRPQWTPVTDDWPRYLIAQCYEEGKRSAEAMARCSGLAVDQRTFESCYRGGLCHPQRLARSLRPPTADELLALRNWGTFLPPLYPSQQTLRTCWSSSGGQRQQFGSCVVREFLTPAQKAILQCYEKSRESLDIGLCTAGASLSDADRALAECLADAYGDQAAIALCFGSRNTDPRVAAALQCVQQRRTAMEVQDCLLAAGAGNAGPQVACVKRYSSDRTAMLTCVGSTYLPPRQRAIADCALRSDSMVSFGVCAAGKEAGLTEEQQIVAECLATTGGEPYSFAACAGGRLTVRELEKCFTNGIGGTDGCFGENNTIVVGVRNIWSDLTTGLGPNNELVRALRTIENDLKNGFGPNNDIVRTLNNAWSDVTRGPGENNDLVKAGRQLGKIFGF